MPTGSAQRSVHHTDEADPPASRAEGPACTQRARRAGKRTYLRLVVLRN